MIDEQITQQSTENIGKQEGEFGKFKSSEELVKAYSSLEKEFTKRSQRLKELEKSTAKSTEPIDWEKTVDDFIQKYPSSQELLDEIGGVVESDPALLQREKGLELAYLEVLSKKFRSEKSYAEDGEFLLKYAPLNKDVRAKIIGEYVSSLNQPVVRTIGRGGEIPIAEPIRPKTVEDAGSMALKILKNNLN